MNGPQRRPDEPGGAGGKEPAAPAATPILAARPYRRRWLAAGLLVIGLGLAGAGWWGVTEVQQIVAGLPPTPQFATMPVSVQVVDNKGALLRAFTTPDGLWRLPVGEAEVDRGYLAMLIAYEDRHFATHGGIDWLSMLRAAGQFVMAGGHIVSGGSTLTMQVARLIEHAPTHDFGAKIRQMVHAEVLERTLSKRQILDLYLTLAPFGGNIEGVRAASLAYFGKEPNRLTTAEEALLVALPQSPEARRPDLHPKAALAARNRVLARMVGEHVITAEEAEVASGEPVPTGRRDFPLLAPHLAREAAAARPDARRIVLTVDKRLQASLEALAAARAHQWGPKASVAILAADVDSGRVLASVGSAGLLATDRDGFIDMTEAERSPGSTLKPLIYGLAFEFGLAHPESLIEDRPTAFGAYAPVDFDGLTRGTVTMREALQQSLNIPAIVTLDAVGVPRLMSRLRRAHVAAVLPDNTRPGLAIGLGGVGVTLRDLVSLYAAIARGGQPVQLYDGVEGVPQSDGPAAPVLGKLAAWYVANILAGVPPPINGSPGRIAYKTGTSYGYRDGWAIGFDGRTVIGVWVGRPDAAPVPGLAGITAAAPILFEAFDRLGRPAVPLPPPPPGAIFGNTAQLPAPLRHFRHPDAQVTARDPAPKIAFPADGVAVDLGLAAAGGARQVLTVKVRNGKPPFTFLANGAPFGRTAFARQDAWTPDGPGFVTLSVVDSEGRSDSVKVFVD